MPTPYEATFSVSLKCDSCIKDISRALSTLSGIQETSFSLDAQIIRIKGTEPPSRIIKVIEETGRDTILRGSGEKGDSAVSILEIPPFTSNTTSSIKGLARFIQLTPQISLLDLSISNITPGKYSATIRQCGDISRGVASMGGVYLHNIPGATSAVDFDINSEGEGRFVGEVEWCVGDIIGRGMLLAPDSEEEGKGEGEGVVVVGVVAKSAGVWENERKVVCSCSGMTVWEERDGMRRMGIL